MNIHEGKEYTLHAILTNFSTRYLVLFKVYTGVGGKENNYILTGKRNATIEFYRVDMWFTSTSCASLP